MVIEHDEISCTLRLIDDFFNEVVFEVKVSNHLELGIMLDFLLLYVRIIELS